MIINFAPGPKLYTRMAEKAENFFTEADKVFCSSSLANEIISLDPNFSISLSVTRWVLSYDNYDYGADILLIWLKNSNFNRFSDDDMCKSNCFWKYGKLWR